MEIFLIDYISRAVVLLFNRSRVINHTCHIYNPNLVNMNNLGEVFTGLDYYFWSVHRFLVTSRHDYNTVGRKRFSIWKEV